MPITVFPADHMCMTCNNVDSKSAPHEGYPGMLKDRRNTNIQLGTRTPEYSEATEVNLLLPGTNQSEQAMITKPP